MYFVMSENNGKIELVDSHVFQKFEDADRYAKSFPSKLKTFVVEKVKQGFVEIVANMKHQENVLLHFYDSEEFPCVEMGTFVSDEKGVVSFSLFDGEVPNFLPRFFAPIPFDHDFIELTDQLENAPLSEAVLLKFENGYITSGIFEEGESGIEYSIWDGESLNLKLTHYSLMPKFENKK